MKLSKTLWRSIRLRCPSCGEDRVFRGWFRLQPACKQCGLPFKREAGFYLGSIYVNYGLTAVLVTIAYFALYLAQWFRPTQPCGSAWRFACCFRCGFFPMAQSLVGLGLLLRSGRAAKNRCQANNKTPKKHARHSATGNEANQPLSNAPFEDADILETDSP